MLVAVFDRYGSFDAYDFRETCERTSTPLVKGLVNKKRASSKMLKALEFTGAEDGDRTRDPNLGKVVLYL